MAADFSIFGDMGSGPVGDAGYSTEVRARAQALRGARAATAPGTAAPTAVSAPTAQNPAPVATAAAASQPTFGQRLLSGLKGLARGIVPVAGIGAAVQGAQTDTETYAKRFGLENTEPGVARDLAVRGLGVASDLGNTLGLGLPGLLFRDRASSPALAPAVAPVVAPAAPVGGTIGVPDPVLRGTIGNRMGGAAAAAAGSGGVVRNDTTGGLVGLKSSPEAYGPYIDAFGRQTGAAPVARAVAPVAAPKLGTDGSIFSNLVPFVNDVNQRKLDTAQSGQAFNRAVKVAPLINAERKLGIDQQNAASNATTASARVLAALKDSPKVVQGLDGKPIVVTQNGTKATALDVKPQTVKVTEADLKDTMKASGLSRAETLNELRKRGHDVSNVGG